MSVTEAVEVEPARWPTGALADALVDRARAIASAECEWLGLLAEFDRREGWRADGQLSCVDWLVWRCGLCRVTARDKLRVAHELERRPAIRAALAAGELSYSKVRAMTRIRGADAETDRAPLAAAAGPRARSRGLPGPLRPAPAPCVTDVRRDDGGRGGAADRGG